MGMDMLRGAEIAQARLDDWRKLAQGLHARYLVPDFATAARLVVAVGEALKAALEARGFTVIHDTTNVEGEDITSAYSRSLRSLPAKAGKSLP